MATLEKNVVPQNDDGYYKYRCVVTENSYSTADNTSNVTITFSIKGPWSGDAFYDWSTSYGIIVDGETKVKKTSSPHVTGTYLQLLTWTGTITHDSDGGKDIAISVYLKNGSAYYLPKQYSESSPLSMGTVSLTDIPRDSTFILSASSVNVGDKITANINRANSSFTHDVEFYINSTYYKKYTEIGTSRSYTIPTSWYSAMPSSTSCTAYCRVTTYNGSTQVGESAVESFTVKIPSDIKPSGGTITVDPVNITTTDGVSRDVLVKGKNKISISASSWTAGGGSSIKNYKFEVLSGSTVIASTTTTGSTATLGTFSQTGSLSFKVTVTDNRSRSNSTTTSYTCYDYFAPSVSSFSSYRVDSYGNSDVNGAYLRCEYTVRYATVNSTNKVIITPYLNSVAQNSYSKTQSSSNGTVSGTIDVRLTDTNATYRVYVGVEDIYGGAKTSTTATAFGESRIINITSDGTGIALGKMAESNNLFECRWPAKFDSNITFAEGVQCSLEAEQNTSGVNIAYLMTGQNTSGGSRAGLAVHNSSVYVPGEANSGLVNLGSSGRKWNQLYATNSTISTSDRTQKKDIIEMSEMQEQLFTKLKPVTYKMIDGTGDRTHYGFISQDVENSLLEIGLTGKDFGGFCKDVRLDDNGRAVVDENENKIYDYSLRYSEFIALNTYMIQTLLLEIQELKNEIKDLKELNNI